MKKLLKVLNGESISPPPIWLMRQAGRYLPEYKKLRSKEQNFIKFCNNPKLAKIATLQPIKRFELDCAILFSDILVIPHALGQKVDFIENIGPCLEPMEKQDINSIKIDKDRILNNLSPTFEALELIKAELPESIALLGFCGAPWTLACYMIGGKTCPNQIAARDFALKYPEIFQKLIDILADICAEFLLKQIESGADSVQIFDSWALLLDEQQFNKWCIEPVAKIVKQVKQKNSQAKIIGFPRGIGAFYANYRQKTAIDMLSIDWTLPLSFANDLQKQGPIQGNLDPRRLLVGGKALQQGVSAILENLGKGPLVFNLGHGILPQTPIENVEKMINLVKKNAID